MCPSTPFDGLAPGSFLASLSNSDRDALIANGHLREWPRGGVLVRIGERADTAIVLLGGLVKIHKPGTRGEEVLLSICGPGDLLGEVTAVRDAVRSATATALDAVHALVLGVPELRAFLTEHPRASLTLLDLALGRLHAADERRVEFATAGSLARVSSRLIELVERFGSRRHDGSIEIGLPINQEELASWSSSSKESTARALRTLRELGLIETGRMRLTVLDLGQLRSHAGHA